MDSKQYYSGYLADDSISPLSRKLVDEILMTSPNSVLEFGCGTGKNLMLIKENEHKYAKTVRVYGIDVSLINVIHAKVKNNLSYVSLGDQDWLPKLYGIDVIFTVSVLDHIENVSDIIRHFQRIAKHVFLAEPLVDDPNNFYWAHDYESYGFRRLDYEWVSDGDGNTYYIWHWGIRPLMGENGDSFDFAHDDLGKR